MKRILLALAIIFLSSVNASAAWNVTLPRDNEKLKDTPAEIRANWDAIALGTDPALQITDAKVAASANITDTKLGQIKTAGKTNGTSITNLPGVPVGAGLLPIANVPVITNIKGGTGIDTSNATGVPKITGGVWTPNATQDDVADGATYKRYNPANVAITDGNATLKSLNLTDALPVSSGGTGAATANAALNNLMPSQVGNSGKYATTDGANVTWGTVTQYSVSNTTATGSLSNSDANPQTVASSSMTVATGKASFVVADGYVCNSATSACNVTLNVGGAVVKGAIINVTTAGACAPYSFNYLSTSTGSVSYAINSSRVYTSGGNPTVNGTLTALQI